MSCGTMTGWRVTQEKIRHTTPEPTEMAHTHDAASWGDRSAAIACFEGVQEGASVRDGNGNEPGRP
jgi:hypothetical protein